jgi:hypothetical protein
MQPCLDISGSESMSIGTDGTVLKTNNSGYYLTTTNGDPDAMRRRHLVVIRTADVRTKHVVSVEEHIEGQGLSEPRGCIEACRGSGHERNECDRILW